MDVKVNNRAPEMLDLDRWMQDARQEIAENNVLGYLLDIAAGVMPNPTVGQVRACEVLLKFMVASPQAARTTELPTSMLTWARLSIPSENGSNLFRRKACRSGGMPLASI